MTSATATIEETVQIQGCSRMLAGVLAYPCSSLLTSGVTRLRSGEASTASCSALIAGPHPFLGGDMGNNVVSSLLKSLASQGAVTLAFDYGGVGRSEGGPTDWPSVISTFWREGTFKEEDDWADDAGSAIGSLRQWCNLVDGSFVEGNFADGNFVDGNLVEGNFVEGDLPLVLLGYSFGCWAVVRNLPGSCVKAIVLISPNPKQHTFEQLCDCPVPLLLIHSDNDFTCSVSEMVAWFDTIREPKTRVTISAGEHFFRGHEEQVSDAVVKFLRHHSVLSPRLKASGVARPLNDEVLAG